MDLFERLAPTSKTSEMVICPRIRLPGLQRGHKAKENASKYRDAECNRQHQWI